MGALDSFTKAVYRRLATRHRRRFCQIKMLNNHAVEEDEKFWELYTATLNENAVVQPFEDFFNLYQLVLKTRKVPGAIAELGVYRGGSARLIASLKGDKELHLFDTFEGMPEVHADADHHRTGDFSGSSLEEVKRYLSAYDRISFYKGFFPDSAKELAKTPIRFSLVHLDADIYESTKAGLEFFYPRTVPGGIIISHDYRSLRCPGVKRAFDEFFADKPEPVIELWKTQCLLVKQ
jgi:predicted O-methyltransferase YrrM